MPDTPSLSATKAYRHYQNRRDVNIQKTLEQQKQSNQNHPSGIQIRKKAASLGKNDFLKLLVTQLTHQDPTQPVKDQQFIAQMAQFSSLEQMQNMTSSLNRLADRQAHELIGRYIEGEDLVNKEAVAGIAEALFYDESGRAFVRVKGRSIPLTKIQMIGDASLAKNPKMQKQNPSAQLTREALTAKETLFEKNENVSQKRELGPVR